MIRLLQKGSPPKRMKDESEWVCSSFILHPSSFSAPPDALTRSEQMTLMQAVLQFWDAAKGGAAILAALALFLITLETRLKRHRALRAVHELRAMAHLIDMYQLTKAPDRCGHQSQPVKVSGRPIDAKDMGHYLHFCTELLAVVSKIGQLYVQDFRDADAQTAVDQFEGLATGLSSKIWQKLMILDRISSDLELRADGRTAATESVLKDRPVDTEVPCDENGQRMS